MLGRLVVLFFSFVLFGTVSFAQLAFNDDNVPYSFDIPDTTWKMTVKPSANNPTVEYVYGDRNDGHLEIRKIENSSALISDLIEKEKEQKLQFLPGYVAGKEEDFSGKLSGKVFNFEFVRSGKTMSGRFYFLKADEKTVYVLRFTGERDKLRLIRNQLDIIARTFRVK